MKFACPKCSTRYNVADEKLPVGKAVRFSCKKCSNTIRLRRKERTEASAEVPELTAPDEATRVASVAEINRLKNESESEAKTETGTPLGDMGESTRVASVAEIDKLRQKATTGEEPPEWFVLVGGKQRGPMSQPKILVLLNQREIDKRTYAWREGMENWARIGDIPAFQGAANRSGDAAWRVVAPVEEGAEQTDPNINKATVAIDANVLQAQLKKAREAGPNPAPVEEPPNEFHQAQTELAEMSDFGNFPAEKTPAPAPAADFAPPTDPAAVLEAADLAHEISAADEIAPPVPQFAAKTPTAEAASRDASPTPQIGEATRVFMAKAGMFARRRNHRVAAVLGSLFGAAFISILALDIVGIWEIPGMGMFYDMTGLQDPNAGRAFDRVDTRLQRADLDPNERARLEKLRAQLMGNLDGEKKPRKKRGRANNKRGPVAEQGIEDKPTLEAGERGLAADIFSDQRKAESKVELAKLSDIQTPNLPEGLTQEAIYKVITDNSKSMKLCVAEASRKGDMQAGRMEIALTIAPDGAVREAAIETAKFQRTSLGGCALKRVERWKFPRFNGEPVTVVFPYIMQMTF